MKKLMSESEKIASKFRKKLSTIGFFVL